MCSLMDWTQNLINNWDPEFKMVLGNCLDDLVFQCGQSIKRGELNPIGLKDCRTRPIFGKSAHPRWSEINASTMAANILVNKLYCHKKLNLKNQC